MSVDYCTFVLTFILDLELHTPAISRSQLIHWVDMSDTTIIGHCRGGVILKLMDEVAGMVAAKHCQTNVVTASFDATNFHKKVGKGIIIVTCCYFVN